MNSVSKELSRQQRRQIERAVAKSEKITYTLTQKQLDEIREEAAVAATEETFVLMIALPVLACRDQFGFGEKRLTDLSNEIIKNFTAFSEGYTLFEDYRIALEEETGMTVDEMIDTSRRLA